MNINSPLKKEINNARCALTILNVVLVLSFGVSFAWIGLGVALFGLIKDFVTERNLNELIMHGSNAVMYAILIIKK